MDGIVKKVLSKYKNTVISYLLRSERTEGMTKDILKE